jgi:hypothetical protein
MVTYSRNALPGLATMAEHHVVAGHEIATWLQRCSTGPVDRDFAEQVLTELEAFRPRVNPMKEARKRTRSAGNRVT